jgi:2-succinyl-5-enolpyruvyl-6-hydroxy-3-cyclohexene-1-carboxylate synthase
MNLAWAKIIVEELVRNGIDYFCISPGSRSTPLTIAVARNDRAQSVICFDERGAAFHALGYARANRKPAAVITTSGTAVGNLLPAVMEASNSFVPMILLTADRPAELLDCGANQTADQTGIFGSYVRWQSTLPCPTADIDPSYILTTVDHGVNQALSKNPGPVHFNCPFREPLSGKECEEVASTSIETWRDSQEPYTQTISAKQVMGSEDLETISSILNRAKRGMLFVGSLGSDEERTAVMDLAELLNWPIYADLSSGLNIGTTAKAILRYCDQELLPQSFNDMIKPDVVLHFGGRITSKRVGLFFEQNRPESFIVIKPTTDRQDDKHVVTHRVCADITLCALQLSSQCTALKAGEFYTTWYELGEKVDQLIGQKIDAVSILSEPFVARKLTELVPDSTSLFISNSMPIRDADIYGVAGSRDLKVGVNRGVSGIDGIMATATGFAAGNQSLTTVLIGDVAFMHDMNSLALITSSEKPVIVVVVNNSGGGIFHFLPVSQEKDVFEPYFTTPHDYSFAGVCSTFGLKYTSPSSKAEFVEAYNVAVGLGESCVIEVVTNREDNLKLRRDIKQQIISDCFDC